jgi:diguanylate cyclase (GGDEF)-like protein
MNAGPTAGSGQPSRRPQLQLGRRLTRAAVVAAGAALFMAGLILNVYIYYWLHEAAASDLEVQARVTADSAIAAMMFADARAAGEMLESLRAAPTIVSATLVHADGKPFASWKRTGVVPPAEAGSASAPGFSLFRSHIDVSVPVQFGDRPLGRLVLAATLEPLKERTASFVLITVCAAFASLAMAWSLANGIRRDVERAETRLDELAHVDSVTGLLNRHAANAHLQAMVARASDTGRGFGLLLFDLDDFKLINDTLGHSAGDEVLRHLGSSLRRGVRPGDQVFRLGGDEFIVISEDPLTEEGAQRFATLAMQTLKEPLQVEGQQLHLQGSAGVARFPEDARDAASLLGAADVAMYAAKTSGKNMCMVYRPEMASHTHSRLQIDTDLRQALQQGGLVLHYQPIVEATGGRLVGAEALLRWQHPQRGLLLPEDFMEVAESNGLVVDVGAWVLEAAARQLMQWHAAGRPDLTMAVNVSGRQIERGRLLSQVQRVQQTGVDLRRLEIEITEHTLVSHAKGNISTLEALRALGMRIAIDDFGTGLSSLTYLKRLPIDKLKIDRSFVSELPAAEDTAIVSAVVALARALGLSVVAEGVETQGQLEVLADLGCNFVQGYLLGRPMAANEFAHRFLGLPLAIDRAPVELADVARV